MLLLAVVVALAVVPTALQADDREVDRSAGPSRVDTAVAASAEHRDAADAALLASARAFPDALAGGALAAREGAPVLLTEPGHLPPIVSDELDRLGVATVHLLGGPRAISPAVEAELISRGHEVQRHEGDDRYATARALARAAGPSPEREIVVALGEHADPSRAWPDALAAGTLAAAPGHPPTLLTRQDSLPAATEQALAELDTERVTLTGDIDAVSEHVEQRLTELGYAVTRLAGRSRYHTSVALAEQALDRLPAGPHPVVFASGERFADALSAGPLAASLNAPVVLVPRTTLAGVVDDFLRVHVERWSAGVVVGGSAAVADTTVDELADALHSEPDEAPAEEDAVTFEGHASWYGEDFRGNETACGERFDPDELTAAYPDLDEVPCGSVVRVTNVDNGRQVEVRITDEGPNGDDDRVLDASRAAAEELGFRAEGTAHVRGEVLDR